MEHPLNSNSKMCMCECVCPEAGMLVSMRREVVFKDISHIYRVSKSCNLFKYIHYYTLGDKEVHVCLLLQYPSEGLFRGGAKLFPKSAAL